MMQPAFIKEKTLSFFILFWCRDFLTGKEKLCCEKLKMNLFPESRYVNLNPASNLSRVAVLKD